MSDNPVKTIPSMEDILAQEGDLNLDSDWRNYVLEEIKDTYESFTEQRISSNRCLVTELGEHIAMSLIEQICAGFYVENIPGISEVNTMEKLADYVSSMITWEDYEKEEAGNIDSYLSGYGLDRAA